MEEYFGIAVDKAARYIHSRRLNKWLSGEPFTLKESLRRFTTLASLLSGFPVRVVDLRGDVRPKPYAAILHKMAHPAILPEHAFAWSDRETIYLPISIADMDSPVAQEELARYLVFFLSAQIKYGTLDFAYKKRDLLTNDQTLVDIFWIMENTRLFHIIRNEFPALFRNWDKACKHLLTRRPKERLLRRSEKKVEEFFLTSLKENKDTLDQSGPNDSLKAAQKLKEEWEAEGVTFKRYRALVPFVPWGRLIVEKIQPPHAKPVEENFTGSKITPTSKNEDNEKDGNESKEENERSRYMATREKIDEEACEDGLILNIYDKILSWAEFVNVSRPFDDDPDDESDKKADQLEELTTAETERSAGTSFNADLEREAAPVEEPSSVHAPGAEVFTYPEWDYQKKITREDYSRLTETYADVVETDFVDKVLDERKGLIKDIRRKFELINPDTHSVSRQMDGDHIDIDAAIEALINVKAGKEAGEKLYISSRKTERDLSTLFLVDLSMSTDAWVKDKRIIDHEKEALVILCEAMEVLGDRYAIYGFSGKTRNNCRYFSIKGFDETYNKDVRTRIGSLIPYQYTRMGPAVRHSTYLLNKETSRAKLLFLISDGKPNDMDAYEGRYGVEDTRMAIREAERKSITPFCLTVDSKSGEYLPRIFGAGNYAVLASVEKLTRKLPELYARMVRQL